jgi:Nuclear pore protein 84 / 107
VLEGARHWKEELVLLYLDTLVSHEDLWYMLVLYASFLPKSVILDHLPSLLQHIQSRNERSVIVRQLSEVLPEEKLDLEVLRRTYEDSEKNRNQSEPTRLEVRKMESVRWLSFHDNHIGEALIAANTLLRQFLLVGKIPVAIKFRDDVLKDLLTNFVENAQVAMVDCSNDELTAEVEMRIQYARLEHIAYLLFLEATERAQHWKTIIRDTKHTHTSKLLNGEGIDTRKLNSVELPIALHAEQRNIIDSKRATSQVVVVAAEAACAALREILEHTGGWLLTDDETVAANDFEGEVRQKELEQLRKTFLPYIATTYHEVCVGTAEWMSKSLDDAAETLDVTAYQAVHEIDDSLNLDQTKSTLKSPVAPRFWTQKALKVADMIENETYKVGSAFRSSDYQQLLSYLAETAVLDFKYRYAE